MKKALIIVLAVVALLMGCGKEEIKQTEARPHSMTENIQVENIEVETIEVETIEVETIEVSPIEVEEINVITWDNSPNITYWED